MWEEQENGYIINSEIPQWEAVVHCESCQEGTHKQKEKLMAISDSEMKKDYKYYSILYKLVSFCGLLLYRITHVTEIKDVYAEWINRER